MIRLLAMLLALAGTFAGVIPAAASAGTLPGVQDAARAHQNYMLQCQGCHRPDASGPSAAGNARSTPAMAGIIGKFLTVAGGRAYLIRVPGMATSQLDDAQLAELANWTLYRFDPAHVPANFKPYSASEVGALRAQPLRTDAAAVRAELTAKMSIVQGQTPTGSLERRGN